MWNYFYLLSIQKKKGQYQARCTQSSNNKGTARSLKDLKLISLIKKKNKNKTEYFSSIRAYVQIE